eukprot:TRINITY_DN1772_c0_g2_i1.p1 TRINITY_DN1772_c0_g2~~TRINITY_DN1772_c0_g2_i1.p1  ORF type:complete len:186 (-),score=35.59 TRINITY_DN1772_c0_g2_i1:61-618(-)
MKTVMGFVGFLMFCVMVQCAENQDGAMMGAMTDEQMELQMIDIEDVDDEEGCFGTAVYSVVADFTWSAASHPTDYPAGSAHWSPFSGTTHSAAYRMWGIDLKATPGVQQVAETGANALLKGEIEACGDDCTPMFVFESVGVLLHILCSGQTLGVKAQRFRGHNSPHRNEQVIFYLKAPEIFSQYM